MMESGQPTHSTTKKISFASDHEGTQEESALGNTNPFSFKAIAAEIHKDDAVTSEMRVSLPTIACAPRVKPQNLVATHPPREGATSRLCLSWCDIPRHAVKSKREKVQAATVLQSEAKEAAGTFIEKKREIGLVRMSLASKKAEIRKYEEAIDRAEKHLRQQRDQLENTREKFSSFLKHSNLEQDAAVRRADSETKAKQKKTIEIKRLSSRINYIELEMRKIEIHMDNCKAYKQFLYDLVKPQWFYDVLTELRAADRIQEIALETDAAFETRAAELQKQYDLAEEKRKQHQKQLESRHTGGYGRDYGTRSNSQSGGSMVPEWIDALLEPLETQLQRLHSSMEAEAQEKVDAAVKQIRSNVAVMPVKTLKSILSTEYDESRIPLPFKNVSHLLDVFIDAEEGNLFLIQNCQELEEDLENVTLAYMSEKNAIEEMVEQRQSQMHVFREKIRVAEGKLKELENRIALLDKTTIGIDDNSKMEDAAADSSKKRHNGRPVKPNDFSTLSDPSPEDLKIHVDQNITAIFRILTSGDNIIKHLTAQHQRLLEREQRFQQQRQQDAGTSIVPDSPTVGATHDETKPRKTTKKQQSVLELNQSSSPGNKKLTARQARKFSRSSSAVSRGQLRVFLEQAQEANQPVANMGPVEMLTIIENKIEEYHRYITDPDNLIEENLILAVIKQSDKERRRKMRLQLIAQQEREQEIRIQRALERSNAPVMRRTGKPVFPRSHLVQERIHSKSARKRKSAPKSAMDKSIEEFFT